MTTPTAPDTWFGRDLPVLVAAVERVDEQRTYGGVRLQEIAESTGLEVDTVYASARALEDSHLVEMAHIMPGSHSRITAVSGGARQLAGSWPSEENFADRLLAAVAALEEQATTEAERTRLQRLRDALGGAGRDVLVSVASAVISGQIPR